MKKFLLLFSSALLLLSLGLAAFLLWANDAPLSQKQQFSKPFEIAGGESWSSLGQRLENEGLIRSQLAYKLILRFVPHSTLKAGSFPWQNYMSIRELIAYFQVAPPVELTRVTIPEGYTLRQVAGLLENKGIVPAREFLAASRLANFKNSHQLSFVSDLNHNGEAQNLEGLLFPDTYLVPRNFPAEKMVALMLENFLKNLDEIYPDWKNMDKQELYEKIVLASIIQKEYRLEEEAPKMASVFYNRLQRGMRLESCATIVYVLTEELGRPHPSRILFRDLEERSPYNTYLNSGLPPEPIGSVGRVALEAVFFPVKSNYLFFVVKDAAKGSHTFTATLKDHNAARESYLNTYFAGR